MKNLKGLRQQRGLTQEAVARALGIGRSTYTQYETGASTPDIGMVRKISEYFDVSMEEIVDGQKRQTRIPVLGYVRAGVPNTANEEIIGYEALPPSLVGRGEFFALKIRGDSMEPMMYSGDIVLIRQQPDIESGEIGIVLVGGEEATCKKVIKHRHGIQLSPLNPDYDPLFFSNDEIESLPVQVLGKVVELRRRF